MTYEEYIAYHRRGDAGVEERMIASICRSCGLEGFEAFRLIYFYTMTYHIPSALDMLFNGERRIDKLKFRTDRRYVRCNGAFPRLLEGLTADKYVALKMARTTEEAYNEVRKWYFFGRYAAYLFLEVWCNVFRPGWLDNLKPGWEPGENYTRGAEILARSKDRNELDKLLDRAKKDTGDNVFAIETSLCAVAKFEKGTRYDGYYTERMLSDATGTSWETLIYTLAR